MAYEADMDLVEVAPDSSPPVCRIMDYGKYLFEENKKREMAHQELGLQLLKRVEGDLAEIGTVEQYPRLEGRQMVMVIAPKKK
jgi:translation initiation factor IF-3